MSLLWRITVAAALIAMVAVNALANALPINGLNTGQVSDGYRMWFVPAGYVFSIWGLIYLALIAFTLTQAFSRSAEPLVAPVRPLFVVSCLANGAWIFAWHYLQVELSVALMLVLLGALLVIYRRLRATPSGRVAPLLRWTVLVPFSLYLAWICVATIANISAMLVKQGWSGQPLSGATWAAVMMAVASALILRLALTFDDATPPLVLIWALVGIMVRFPTEPVILASGGLANLALLGGLAWLLWRRRRSPELRRAT